jgi:hypothetical protein
MNLRMSHGKIALIGALLFLGIAVFVLFVIHPGGFEGQIGWLYGLMPGALVVASAADRIGKLVPIASPGVSYVVFWSAILGVTFLWYFAITYGLVKAFHFISLRFNRRIPGK